MFQWYRPNTEAYASGRPGYPPEVNDWLRDTLLIKPGSVVVDLGAGTGKFTSRLVDLKAKVVAVEPLADMRSAFKSRWPGIDVIEGRAEEIPLLASSVDAVVCAQAFHLFANEEAMKEIHRILKPGGRLGLIWNLRDTSVAWVKALADIVTEQAGEHPRYYSGEWRKALSYHKFSPINEKHFRYVHSGAPEDVIVNRVRSISFINGLPAEQQAPIFERIRQLVATHPDLAGRETVELPYDTAAFHTVKILP